MGYRDALRLVELVGKYKLLRDPLARAMLRYLSMSDDPRDVEEAEEYIGWRIMNKILSRP